ncbi:MAG: hypothetical protein K6G22_09745 [Lachnospiraceae bacterium]|nr:hypothetical protein [Lachnospiraceae bacterium]
MTAMEITLLVVGVIIFAASFFIKDKEETKTKDQLEEEKRQIRSLMENELEDMKIKVNDATNETVEYAMDKAERSLEKVSNEKIMAVNEYSTMVMEEIDKSHKEVMFLYDMLNDKQADVKASVRKADATVREVQGMSEAAMKDREDLKKDLDDYTEKKLEEMRQAAERASAEHDAADLTESKVNVPASEYTYSQPKPMTAIDIIKAKKAENNIQPVFNAFSPEGFDNVSISDPSDAIKPLPEKKSENTDKAPNAEGSQAHSAGFKRAFGAAGGNNNQKIIELHESGMSTVDIAKTLNLGVGEVKLVIDLFKR